MRLRFLCGVAALALATATMTGLAQQASAAPAAVPTPDGNVSSTMAPAWQTNNTVWALAYANGVVYVGGQFTSVRPPGDAASTGEVARTYLAAFSSTTGALITSFNPTITGSVRVRSHGARRIAGR